MSFSLLFPLLICILAVAILYSSVGHGGASGYIATLALFSVAPVAFKPTALLLNILVAAVATYSFARAGHFNWRLFWPFAATSIPLSFVGGYLVMPSNIYKPLIGLILLTSASLLLFQNQKRSQDIKSPSIPVAMAVGAGLGLLSGITGVGGGIFLSPLLLLLNWGGAREVSAVASLFILVNSVAGLLGHLSGLHSIPSFAPLLAIAALVGGIIGSFIGSNRYQFTGVVRALSAVLAIAGVKMILV